MQNNDLISREALLDAIDHERNLLIEQKRFGAEHVVVHHARRLIEEFPAVDAAQVVHGRWANICETDCHLRECSVCRDWQIHYEKYIPNYCPNCGARMDGGEGIDVGEKASAD